MKKFIFMQSAKFHTWIHKVSLLIMMSLLVTLCIPNDEATGQSTTAASGKKDNALFKEQDFAPIDMKSETQKRIYQQIPLEDFETNQYTSQQMQFRDVDYKTAKVQIRSEYPAPIRDSRKYLGIKVFGKREDAIYIYPTKPIQINQYCLNIHLWAYGKGLSGILQLVVKDNKDNTHHLNFGQINHFGWRFLSIKIPHEVYQQDLYLNQKSNLRIVAIVFNPGNSGTENQWSYLYIDDLTATVRGKYTDRQSDNW